MRTATALTPAETIKLQAAITVIDAELAANPTNWTAQGDRSYIGDLLAYGPASAGYGADPAWNIADALAIADEYVA